MCVVVAALCSCCFCCCVSDAFVLLCVSFHRDQEPVKLWRARILRDVGSSSSSSTGGGGGGAAPGKGLSSSQTPSPVTVLRPPDKSSSVVDVSFGRILRLRC